MRERARKKRHRPNAGAEGARVRFEVAGRSYEGTLGHVTGRYAADRRRDGRDWPGGVGRS